ncbi:MAG: hypothetical protein K5650_01080 [Bacteroidales bacterium]|nr:hypothetical protein [Bacteroidales bacterium]
MRAKVIIILIISFFCTITSCKREDLQNNDIPYRTLSRGTSTDGVMVLGNQLDNSYSVDNMRNAYRNLRKSNMIDSINIDTTHIYICFYPESAEEIDILIEDSTIDVFPYPLDYEIVSPGVYYPDTTLRQCLYAVVPKNYPYRIINDYKILEYCYIPDIDNNPDLEILEHESLDLTGNLIEMPTTKLGHAPSGRIRVQNTFTNRKMCRLS